MTKYPNLAILAVKHHYHYATFAAHANVTPALFMRVLQEGEELTGSELAGISRLTGVPVAILAARDTIRFQKQDGGNIDKMAKLIDFFEYVKANSSGRSDFFQRRILETAERVDNLQKAFNDNRASYCGFVAVEACVKDCLELLAGEVRRAQRRG